MFPAGYRYDVLHAVCRSDEEEQHNQIQITHSNILHLTFNYIYRIGVSMTTVSDIELHPLGVSNGATTTTTLHTDHSGDIHHDADDEDEDDNMTIIFLETESGIPNETTNDISSNNNNLPNWMDRTGDAIFEERRRTILLHELKRIQRRSFLNFVILCSLPMLLFTMMIIIIFTSDEETCPSTITNCRMETRTFANAFTTRCLCDPIPVERNTTAG